MADTTRTPRNVEGQQYYEIEEIEVGEWHPLPDGKGRPEQVHLRLTVAGLDHPLVARFKSPRSISQVIDAMTRHRDNVWPD